MSKIKRITVSNLKAVSQMSADFNGCTAIITGGNNKGKTSFLRSLFDRVRGVKPDAVLKQGETEGFAEAELTTGEKLKWEFNDKGKGFKEKLTYISDKDIKSPLTVELRTKFLPDIFDVDKFLQDAPAKQKKTLQQLVGIDFADVDARYKSAYDARESKNRRAHEEKILLEGLSVPPKVDPVDLNELTNKKSSLRDELNKQYLANKSHNEQLRNDWRKLCNDMLFDVDTFNGIQNEKAQIVARANQALSDLRILGYEGNEVYEFIEVAKSSVEPLKTYIEPPQPDYIEEIPDRSELDAIDQQILDATKTNEAAKLHTDYLSQKQKTETAKSQAEEADTLVKSIEKERMDLIKSAKMPEGFGFVDDGITYNGLSFTREQLSSSGIYIAALKLAAMTLGEVKALHFDASFLDKNSLGEIEKWAESEDLQLLIERPDFEGGEIEYQLLSV